MINTLRERKAEGLTLYAGKHPSGPAMCLTEAVAYAAGEAWSDLPVCACRVLTAYGRVLNDSMPDAMRQRLVPLVSKLVGSRSTREIERQRSYLLVDASVRTFAPLALRAAGLKEVAETLECLPPIVAAGTAMRAARAAAAAATASRSAWAFGVAARAAIAKRAAYAARAADAATMAAQAENTELAALTAALTVSDAAWTVGEAAEAASTLWVTDVGAYQHAAWTASTSVWDKSIGVFAAAIATGEKACVPPRARP